MDKLNGRRELNPAPTSTSTRTSVSSGSSGQHRIGPSGSGGENPQDDSTSNDRQQQQKQQQQQQHNDPQAEGRIPPADAVETSAVKKSEDGGDVLQPLLPGDAAAQQTEPAGASASVLNQFRSRKKVGGSRRRKRGGGKWRDRRDSKVGISPFGSGNCFWQCLVALCCHSTSTARNTVRCMNFMAKVLFWCSVVALAAGVFWYSYELHNNGKEAHLIAWFSAGAFVLLGFPISMWGIVSHLANYNQPHVQVYIVRILFMVPIYSIQSWLAMRFYKQAIYIETLRDFYESYVLYSFLQYLIQVLGGEEALILMLKDKSPTRGFHMWGLQWCVKPWLMGQPVRKTVYQSDDESGRKRAMKRVHWKSPFFIKCKFGVLQYVLLKFLSAVAVMILELNGWYKEGDFTPKGGYLYICILTNLSQCWALYCLIFFYYATHTELSPIRPVGKFLSVKALVFFTWWQSVMLAIMGQMNMIPNYSFAAETITNTTSGENGEPVYTYEALPSEYVAKGIQDYLICIEMFLAAVVHVFVFPHSEYSPQAVEARHRALNQAPMKWNSANRLGRSKYAHAAAYAAAQHQQRMLRRLDDGASKSSGITHDLEMATFDSAETADTWDDPLLQRSPRSGGGGNLIGGDGSPDTGESPPSSGVSPEQVSMSGSLPQDEEGALDDHHHAQQQSDLQNVVEGDEEDTLDGDLVLVEAAGPAITTREQRRLYPLTEAFTQTEDTLTEYYDEENTSSSGVELSDDSDAVLVNEEPPRSTKPGFVRALLDSAIPLDLRDNTVGIVKGDYEIEKKTLLQHATVSDQYDLFSPNRKITRRISEAEHK